MSLLRVSSGTPPSISPRRPLCPFDRHDRASLLRSSDGMRRPRLVIPGTGIPRRRDLLPFFREHPATLAVTCALLPSASLFLPLSLSDLLLSPLDTCPVGNTARSAAPASRSHHSPAVRKSTEYPGVLPTPGTFCSVLRAPPRLWTVRLSSVLLSWNTVAVSFIPYSEQNSLFSQVWLRAPWRNPPGIPREFGKS